MAEILCRINSDFYRNHGDSFSETRGGPWHGWERCLSLAGLGEKEGGAFSGSHGKLSVLDLACGNLRFARYLSARMLQTALDYYAFDNADALVLPQLSGKSWICYRNLDIMDVLLREASLDTCLVAPPCDLAVCFGFMHHVPLAKYREELLASLVTQVCEGGFVFVSFWQFLENPTLARKAQKAHRAALEDLGIEGLAEALGENDFLLDWKGVPGAWRYCHSFTEAEIDSLVASLAGKARVVDRFNSDGRSGDLNSYLVLQH